MKPEDLNSTLNLILEQQNQTLNLEQQILQNLEEKSNDEPSMIISSSIQTKINENWPELVLLSCFCVFLSLLTFLTFKFVQSRRLNQKQKEIQGFFNQTTKEHVKTISDLFCDLKTSNLFSLTENDEDEEVIYQYGQKISSAAAATEIRNPNFVK